MPGWFRYPKCFGRKNESLQLNNSRTFEQVLEQMAFSRRLGRGKNWLGCFHQLYSVIACNSHSHSHSHKHLRYGDAQSCGDEGPASSEQLQSEAVPEFYTANYSHITSIFKIPSKGKAQVSQEYTFDVPTSIEKLNIHTSVSWKLTWQRSWTEHWAFSGSDWCCRIEQSEPWEQTKKDSSCTKSKDSIARCNCSKAGAVVHGPAWSVWLCLVAFLSFKLPLFHHVCWDLWRTTIGMTISWLGELHSADALKTWRHWGHSKVA